MQLAIDQLLEELDRISSNIEFNARHMLDGAFAELKIRIAEAGKQAAPSNFAPCTT